MKKLTLTTLTVLLCVLAQAAPFLIGAFAQYDLSESNSTGNDSVLKTKLLEAGYNAATISVFDDNLIRLGSVLSTFGDSIKTILSDQYWNPDQGKVGIDKLTYGNYLKMEAEYMYLLNNGSFRPDSLTTIHDPHGTSDVYNYVFQHDANCGKRNGYYSHDYSNGHAWICDSSENDQLGIALTNPRFRWKNDYRNTYPRSICYDFKFCREALVSDTLYLTVAMKYSDVAEGRRVATVSLKALNNVSEWTELQDYMNNPDFISPDNYVELPLSPVNGGVGTTITCRYDYETKGVERDDWENYLFEYKVKLPDPVTQAGLYDSLMVEHWSGSYFRHIVPEIKWWGNGKMELDYIILEDEYHRQARQNESNNTYFTMMDSRLNQIKGAVGLTNYENIIYHLTKEEPFQGQFSMYNKVENYLGSTANLITPVNLEGYNVKKVKGTSTVGPRYKHYLNFFEQAKPKSIAIDVYPLGEWGSNSENFIHWNDQNHDQFVQVKIDTVLVHTYNSLAHAVRYNVDPSLRATKIIYIPQIYGEFIPSAPTYPRVGGLPNFSVKSWRTFKPPLSMIKCLQFMPLCYDADGILDFALLAQSRKYENEYFRLAPLTHDSLYVNLRITDDDSSYQNLTEANQKIAVYGPLITDLKWSTADCLMPNGGSYGVAISNFLSTSPWVSGSVGDPPITSYSGYVQCGYYHNDKQLPSFMLVNRRAVYRKAGEGTVVQLPVDRKFINAGSQIVSFIPSGTASSSFGSYIAMYDPYDEAIYRAVSDTISVVIGPGDGKLLEMCGTLPSHVAANSTLSNKAVLEGTVNILPGVNVVTNSGTETKILSNSVINIGAGASYTLRGDVIIGDGVTINVSQNGSLNFDDADCTWGTGSYIVVNEGTLSINGGNMLKSSTATTWGGIRVSDSNSVLITDANISDAHYHSVTNSNLEISNSKISFPANSLGLLLQNNTPGYSTEISASDYNEKGIFGESNTTSRGITLGIMKNPVIIDNVTFHNLKYGIEKTVYPHASNSITWCRFVNCGTGVRLNNNGYNTSIQRCTFTNYQTGKQGTGIQLTASLPSITGCSFNNLSRGILTELSLATGLTFNAKIKDSNFKECETGIESRGSNHRLETNCFNRNDYGIINHAGSNLNLSDTANNIMKNRDYNIVFNDTAPYQSTIQLFAGYNDFYHLIDNTAGTTAKDFCFDSNYQGSPSTHNTPIDASVNWFQGNQVTVNDPAYANYVYVGLTNSQPSMPDPDQPPIVNRLYAALDHESQGFYDLAAATYQAIIDDMLDEEKPHVTSAIDGLYRCTGATSTPLGETIDYIDVKADQYSVDSPALSAILKEYLLKMHLVNKDFQSAVDLLQPRISEPISEVDSLRAVLDLEIVLQLAAAEETKCPVITEYTQYQYPNFQVFEVMHSKNWEKYRQALQKNNPNMANIPAFPTISNNYPNPFNPSTTIAYSIPEDGLVKIDIYNIKGQKVKQLCNTEMRRGHHKVVWNGKDKNERSVSSGVYFVRLQANGQISARKIMLMK